MDRVAQGSRTDPIRVGAQSIVTARLLLTPLTTADADVMVDVLADPRLHEFTGGEPLTVEELRDRYRRLVAGSPTAGEAWLNWIVRRREDRRPVGTVQATLVGEDDRVASAATVAWVVGVEWQHQGFASEAAAALVERLLQVGVARIEANIHPSHVASEHVAARAGLRPTDDVVGAERVWRVVAPPVARGSGAC
jgi:RimJ/RimL family protein N-acetyltransferase